MSRASGQNPTWLFITMNSSKNSIFYVSMHFALRGVEEQSTLCQTNSFNFHMIIVFTIQMFSISTLNLFLRIISTGLKILTSMRNKIVWAYAQISNEHCVIKLLDFYLVKLKPNSSLFVLWKRFQKNVTSKELVLIHWRTLFLNSVRKLDVMSDILIILYEPHLPQECYLLKFQKSSLLIKLVITACNHLVLMKWHKWKWKKPLIVLLQT